MESDQRFAEKDFLYWKMKVNLLVRQSWRIIRLLSTKRNFNLSPNLLSQTLIHKHKKLYNFKNKMRQIIELQNLNSGYQTTLRNNFRLRHYSLDFLVTPRKVLLGSFFIEWFRLSQCIKRRWDITQFASQPFSHKSSQK